MNYSFSALVLIITFLVQSLLADQLSDQAEKQKLLLKYKKSVVEARFKGVDIDSEVVEEICNDKNSTITDCRIAIRRAEKTATSMAKAVENDSESQSGTKVIVIQPERTYDIQRKRKHHSKPKGEKLKERFNETKTKVKEREPRKKIQGGRIGRR